jgi:AraC family transcriptional regulator
MQPRIDTIGGKKLVGMKLTMSLTDNRTAELWRSFMTRRKEINNNIGSDLYSMRVYPPSYFSNFNPATQFEKWAVTEVSDFDAVPDGMEAFTLVGGLYAIFPYKGAASAGGPTFQYIYGTWIPNSGYTIDDRPHFDILGEKYKNEDPESEEEIWIPVRL